MKNQTFLHYAALYGSPETMQYIIENLSIQTAKKLSEIVDEDSKTARDLSSSGLTRDWLDQAGKYPGSFYHLMSPPRVLIFYNTIDRERAEEEKNCVENFFQERKFPYSVKKDPTEAEIFRCISEVKEDHSISGLMVFIMSHGGKGKIYVKGGNMSVQDIVTHMYSKRTDGKPKVQVILNR